MPVIEDGRQSYSLWPRRRSEGRAFSIVRLVPQSVLFIDVITIVAVTVTCGIAQAWFSRQAMIEPIAIELGVDVKFGAAVASVFVSMACARGLYGANQGALDARQRLQRSLIWCIAYACIGLTYMTVDGLKVTPQFIAVVLLGGLLVLPIAWRWEAQIIHNAVNAVSLTRQVVAIEVQGAPSSAAPCCAADGLGVNIGKRMAISAEWTSERIGECLSEVVDYVRNHSVEEILLLPNSPEAQVMIDTIVMHLRIVPTPIRLLPDPITSAFLAYPLIDYGSIKVLELRSAPLTELELVTKRLMDLVLTIGILLMLFGVLAIIAALVVVDSPGPVLFLQRRVGFNDRLFHIYKFRTMATLDDGAMVQQAHRGDARITRVGRILRRFSLDELPQLINVLRGEMSLVGPRPHALAHDREYGSAVAFYAARHNIKPGLTGWAQVNGWRGATPELEMMQKRVEHDLWYINHWSLWLDMKILVLTVIRVWKDPNAY